MNKTSIALQIVSQEQDFESMLNNLEQQIENMDEKNLQQKLSEIKSLEVTVQKALRVQQSCKERKMPLPEGFLQSFQKKQQLLESLKTDPQVTSFFQEEERVQKEKERKEKAEKEEERVQKEKKEKFEKFKKDFFSWREEKIIEEFWNEKAKEGKFFIYILHSSPVREERWMSPGIPFGAIYVEVKNGKIFVLEIFGEKRCDVGNSWDVKKVPFVFIQKALENKEVIPKKRFK